MDKFYLENAKLYQSLVSAQRPASPSSGPHTPSQLGSPDMVVSARIRPLLSDDAVAGFPTAIFPRGAENNTVDLHDLYNHPRGRPVLKSYSYQVDRLFDTNATTEAIFDEQVADLVSFAWNGGVGTLFAYGQTGSGKTYTVSRLEQLVFESLLSPSSDNATERHVSVAMIELAGNAAYDLLNSRSPISILEDSLGVTQLSGAVEHVVRDKDEAVTLVERAAAFRRTKATLKNDASSRSHGICRISIKNPATDSGGVLYLVDLAGSEAARDVAEHGAERMRETREINISLSVLKDCIRGRADADAMALSQARGSSKGKKPHIPFRQSALTKVLKHVFDPAGTRACKTVVIACVNPSLADIGPTKNTLRYAELLRVLAPSADGSSYDPKSPSAWSNAQLRDWITRNSGPVPIVASFLAPAESGAQLLRLPAAEFHARCRKTPGVTTETAKAFRARLWQMHMNPLDRERLATGDEEEQKSGRLTSREMDPVASSLPFKDRIRPGMAVSWRAPLKDGENGLVQEMTLAVVLSPREDGRHLCASVTAGETPGGYEVNLWKQVSISTDMMAEEVILEYDRASRYYFVGA